MLDRSADRPTPRPVQTTASERHNSTLPHTDLLAENATRVLQMARDRGATSAEAALSQSRGFSISVRNGDVESLEFQQDRDLSLTVYVGQRRGSASTSDLSERGLAETVAAAIAIANATEEDPFSGLADPARMATVIPELDLDHPWAIDPQQAVELARACEAAALSVDARIKHSEGASLSTQRGVSVYANSHGFVGPRTGTQHSLMASVIAEDGAGMQRDYWWDASRNAALMATAEAIGRKAGERTVRRLGAKPIATGRMPVLYAPEVARSLFGHFNNAISGGALYRKASFLLDKMDQPVFSDIVQLDQRPFIRGAMASAAFDQEGVATQERSLVEAGVLRGWLLSSYTARKLGLETTGNAGGVYNLLVKPGDADFDALVEQVGNGLLLTELMGSSVSMTTGDYSRGAAGFRIENGRVTTPVENITVAGNLLDIFKGIRAIGCDVDPRSSIQTGSVLVDGLTVAGD